MIRTPPGSIWQPALRMRIRPDLIDPSTQGTPSSLLNIESSDIPSDRRPTPTRVDAGGNSPPQLTVQQPLFLSFGFVVTHTTYYFATNTHVGKGTCGRIGSVKVMSGRRINHDRGRNEEKTEKKHLVNFNGCEPGKGVCAQRHSKSVVSEDVFLAHQMVVVS